LEQRAYVSADVGVLALLALDRSRRQLPLRREPGGWVSPKFGRADEDKQEKIEQWRLAIQAEFERLSALPLIELAAEVMIRGFVPEVRAPTTRPSRWGRRTPTPVRPPS